MAVVARFEVEEEIKDTLFETAEGVQQVVSALCPGMILLPPRKEGNTWVFEATMPDEIINNAKRGKVIVLSMRETSAEEYDYNIERKFEEV